MFHNFKMVLIGEKIGQVVYVHTITHLRGKVVSKKLMKKGFVLLGPHPLNRRSQKEIAENIFFLKYSKLGH